MKFFLKNMVVKLNYYARNFDVRGRERIRTHKIYELVLAKATSRDDENARENHREIGGHEGDEGFNMALKNIGETDLYMWKLSQVGFCKGSLGI